MGAVKMPKAGSLTYKERFWSKVDKHGSWAIVRGRRSRCWEWTGGRSSHGYGNFWLNGTTVAAYTVAYEMEHGPIPEGMEPDHLCRNRACVRPLHQEAVTHQENILRSPIAPSAINARKTHCPRGHAYDRNSGKARTCSICVKEQQLAHYYRNRESKITYAANWSRQHRKEINDRLRVARTVCARGHSLTNAIIKSNGTRLCSECEEYRIQAIRDYWAGRR